MLALTWHTDKQRSLLLVLQKLTSALRATPGEHNVAVIWRLNVRRDVGAECTYTSSFRLCLAESHLKSRATDATSSSSDCKIGGVAYERIRPASNSPAQRSAVRDGFLVALRGETTWARHRPSWALKTVSHDWCRKLRG
ncbi:hypothetical protein DER45DRAFT_396470 [Fusarium avenaceum]|nr:hypothetical protein DER45DRAFT_396470 [Fusarium avenaceum]